MVNKKFKKCASLFLAMSMAVSMLAGCGSKDATGETQTTTENTGDVTEEVSSTVDAGEATSDDAGEVKRT